MMKNFYLVLLSFAITIGAQAQPGIPAAVASNIQLDWGAQTKTGVDTCGAYYNNYIGLGKTTSLRIERMRTGNVSESGEYNGRSQKFSAPQPIEISGIEFYSFIDNNVLVDSLMVITLLNEFDAVTDSLGLELARDTVYVLHDNFNPQFTPLPSISVQSVFDAPVIVSSDYLVSIYTPTDDSLRIIANSLINTDGAGEGLGFALYDNANYPSFTGWYDMLVDFSADYDFLISPLVSYQLVNDFSLSDTVACLNSIDHTCADYNQVPTFLSKQYNSNFATSLSSITIDWNDGSVDAGIDSTCHIYTSAGTYDVDVADTLHRWDITTPTCIVNLTDSIIINSPSLVTVIDTACISYTGPSGQVWTSSGVYVDTLVNTLACDSIITFELFIGNPSSSSITESTCGSYTSPSGQVWTASGTYMDTIPNSTNCDSIITFNLTITPVLTASIADTACFQYISPTGQTWTSTGIYTDTIPSASACDSIIITYDITIQDSIDISFTFTQLNLTADFTTVANNVDSVWWDFGDNSVGSSDFNPSHTFPGPGTYNVWLYSFNGCMTNSSFTTITIEPSGLGEPTINKFDFYPNPVSQQLTINGVPKNSTVTIYNIAGKEIYSSKNLPGKSTVDVSDLDSGTYFVRCESVSNTLTKKLIIRH